MMYSVFHCFSDIQAVPFTWSVEVRHNVFCVSLFL